jgi:hypothetical protein
MDTQQLKQLAGRLRAILEEGSIAIGHGQALDLSASLVGLRNWPEVQAFPQRVLSQDLDLSAVARLSYRLSRKHCYEISAPQLLQLLSPPRDFSHAAVPQIWPTGPRPGVYLTTSEAAIDALILQYQEATDGEVFYAERAGTKHDAAIDLGDNGLWSNGLERVPSGTLLVLGPVDLDQQSWSEASERVEMACLRAENSSHRVAILFNTPAPEQLAADVTLMVVERGEDDLDAQIVGTVLDNGTLLPGIDRTYGSLSVLPSIAKTLSLPDSVTAHLQTALLNRATGILAMGSIADIENPGADVAEAGLALTDYLGPAARIIPRHRGTMTKYDQVPDAIRQLPFLPSVESAYAHGYRRFLIDPRYTKPEIIAPYLNDSFFISATYASTAEELALCVAGNYGMHASMLPSLIAAVATAPVQTSKRVEILTDLYIGAEDATVDDGEKVYDYLAQHRTLRIEDQLALLVRSGDLNLEDARQAGADNRTIKRLARLLGSA